MAVPTDQRLLDVPMRPVQCSRCAATVEVRKSSWQQTSIQWHSEALAACAERQQSGPTRRGCAVETCSALRESIADAAREGTVEVPDDGY